jgi:hypothetical protein
MAFTTSDLEAIESAIKSGTLKVKYQDKEVQYRSLSELQSIRNQIISELKDTSELSEGLQKTVGTKRILTSFDKGL